ncbi:MAG TPA: MarR family transcriptional regulator [Acidobacteriaceae bacterium]|nr:MarR family transcriptional regulator [Acidobacteriaceae bacterium]
MARMVGNAVAFRVAIAMAVLHNERVASSVGMSHSEMQSLHLLQLRGPLTPGELAGLTGLSTGTMTAVIDRLEQLGFARRDRHPTDRRKVIVSVLQENVMAAMASYYQAEARTLDAAIASLSREELETVATFLKNVTTTGVP